MKKNFRIWTIFAVMSLLVLYAVGGPTSVDTAKDPVCGMSVKVAGNALTAEHLGTPYYFCSESCKAAFLKDPAKYAQVEAAETPVPAAGTCCGMCCRGCAGMSGMKMMPGQAPVAPAPGVPPAPPAAPAAVAPGAAMPDCPMMKGAMKPCCPMMAQREMRMKRMPGMAMKHGMMGPMTPGACPLCGGMAGKAEVVVENTADGAVVRISSKDPEAVKLIQKHLAAMKAAGGPATCPKARKAEEKVEK